MADYKLREELLSTTALPKLSVWDRLMRSGLGRALVDGKLHSSSGFFEPSPKGKKSLLEPEQYGLQGLTAERVSDKCNVWCPENYEPERKTVIVFEGMAGDFGSLGEPKLARKFARTHNGGWEAMEESNPENDNYRIKRIKALQDEGFNVIAVHLPGFGLSEKDSNGRRVRPSESNFNSAIDDLIVWAQGKGVNYSNTAIVGCSLGGASAARMAHKLSAIHTPPKSLVMVATPESPLEIIVTSDEPRFIREKIARNEDVLLQKLRFDVPEILRGVDQSVRIGVVHGVHDYVVPPYHAELLGNAAVESGHITNVTFLNGGHITINPESIAGCVDKSLEASRNEGEYKPRNTSSFVEGLSLKSLPRISANDRQR